MLKVSDWVQTNLTFHSMEMPKGTIGFILGIDGESVSIQPTHNPNERLKKRYIRTINKMYVDLLPTGPTAEEKQFLIDWALSERDEQTLKDLINREGQNDGR